MEKDEQKALIEWATYASGKHPELELQTADILESDWVRSDLSRYKVYHLRG